MENLPPVLPATMLTVIASPSASDLAREIFNCGVTLPAAFSARLKL